MEAPEKKLNIKFFETVKNYYLGKIKFLGNTRYKLTGDSSGNFQTDHFEK
jgi:hypothetical protein